MCISSTQNKWTENVLDHFLSHKTQEKYLSMHFIAVPLLNSNVADNKRAKNVRHQEWNWTATTKL